MTRALVCGGRNWRDNSDTFVFRELDRLHAAHGFTSIIEGGANGVDHLAMCWASKRGVSGQHFTADWATHGRAAGPIRNKQMLDEGKPDIVIAFPGGKGTRNMVSQAEAAGVPVIEIDQED